MTANASLRDMSDKELADMIGLIEENLAECGPRSSYAHRNKPVLKAALIEQERRTG